MFKNIIEYIFFRILTFFIRILPLFMVRKTAVSFAFFLSSILGYRKGVIMSNLEHAFPEKTKKELKRIGKASLRSFIITIFEMLWLPKLDRKGLLNLSIFRNPEVFEKAYLKGKGVIILTAHFGNWELLGQSLSCKFDVKMSALAKPMRNKYVNDYLDRARKVFGTTPAYMDTGVKEFFRYLLSGGVVALLADQAAPQDSIYVNFFGRPASTFQGPAVFALKSKAPILMAFTFRKPDFSYEIFFEEIDYSDIAGYNEKNILEFSKRHVALLEKYIRENPELWLWSHKRWKHTDKYEIYGKKINE